MGRYTHIHAPLTVGALVALAACGAPAIDAARGLDISGTDSAAEAAREYQRLAHFEDAEMWDKASAIAFSEKALAAAEGEIGRPARAKTDPDIARAYAVLSALRSSGADDVAPKATGQAIARLDCWSEQAGEGYQPKHIGFCRDGFKEYLAETSRALKAAGVAGHDIMAQTKSFTVKFALGSDKPGAGAEEAIAAAAAYARSQDDMWVMLGGHADRSGSADFNRRLSAARAAAVAKALTQKGVERTQISTVGFGETYPLTRTPDGARNAGNRRVEIVVGPAAPL